MDSLGGSTGGTIVGGPSAGAATLAGQYQANAAQAASAQATKAIQDAMNSINQQYANATYAVQPYQSTGVAALDKLNQYMQLPAYNPGAAPTAPVAPTIENVAKGITNDQVRNYINQNIGVIGGPDNLGTSYTGVGAIGNNPNAEGQVYWTNGPGGPTGAPSINHLANSIFGNQDQVNQIKNYLAQDQLPAAQTTYDTANQLYNQNLTAYNQNKDLYDQYTAAGPLTQDQITAQIAAQPGYTAQLNQGVQAIGSASGAKGYLGSGRLLKELSDYGQNTFSQYYGNELSRLAGIANSGQQAATQSSNAALSTGNSLANLYNSLGENQANATLAGGNATAQALLAGNQQYQTIGGSSGGLGGLGSILGGAASLYSAYKSPTAFSSKSLKTKLNTPSTEEILHSVEQLDIDRWNYKGLERAHLGPYAEQFQELFNVGNGQSINMVDVMGVLLASVKALSFKINSLQSELKIHRERI